MPLILILCLGLLVPFGLSSGLRAEETASTLQVDLPYQAARSEPIAHAVDFSAVVTPPYHCEVLKVWLPLPASDRGQEISGSKLSSFPQEVEPSIAAEPRFGNRFAYFEFHRPQGAQIIRHRFTAKVWQLDWKLDPQDVAKVDQWPESFDPYLRVQTLDRPEEFERLLTEAVPQRRGPARDLFQVMKWVDANLTYDHVNASLQADANHALSQRRGHCSDYHGLCTAMGQKLGYPTRVTYGLSLYPKNSPSHCKLEAYLPPTGWVSFDISETQKLIDTIKQAEQLTPADRERLSSTALDRLHAGFRENSWLLLTKGTDYELAPKATKPVRVVRTIYAEADGIPLPEPDPANAKQREFGWMTVHKYTANKPFLMPFKDWTTLETAPAPKAGQ